MAAILLGVGGLFAPTDAGASERDGPPKTVDGHPIMYLTFDDGPGVSTGAMLDVLRRYDARATFFVVGAQAENNPRLVRRIAAEGHSVQSHTWSHPSLTSLSNGGIIAQILRTAVVIERLAEARSSCLRPPYGATSPRVESIARELGHRTIMWSIDPQDWRAPGAGAIASHIISRARPGSIVVLHDGPLGRSQTVAAVESLVSFLSTRGWRFETICPASRVSGGTDTVGVVRGRTAMLRNSNRSGRADLVFRHGAKDDTVVFGDWDGNGTDTVGVVAGRDVMLRNANRKGAADITFSYGAPGDTLVFGDWDGNGTDTVGVIRGRDVMLRNSNRSGRADLTFSYGAPGDTLVFGDWDGNGTDTVGVIRGRDVMLRNSNRSGRADLTFSYGTPGDTLVFGDWDGNGTDTVGAIRGRDVMLRNSNRSGRADLTFSYGTPDDTLVFGNWDGT